VKRALILTIAAATCSIAFVACRDYLPTNRYLKTRSRPGASTADARGKFDHARHTKVLDSQGVSCLHCHRFDLLIESGDDDLARELSVRGQRPDGETCHFCHGPGETRLATAPSQCTTCHENLLALRPADHDIAWMKAHAGAARADPMQCETCHRQSSCIDCHQRRDSIQTRVHDRNFRFFHSVEVRANPMQCGSCHRQDFCSQCHTRGSAGTP
jgi:hypothetical protein